MKWEMWMDNNICKIVSEWRGNNFDVLSPQHGSVKDVGVLGLPAVAVMVVTVMVVAVMVVLVPLVLDWALGRSQ